MDHVNVINILLVEDDTLDVIDTRRTLERMDILYKLQKAKNGEDNIVKPLKLNNPSSIDAFNLMIDRLNIKNKI